MNKLNEKTMLQAAKALLLKNRKAVGSYRFTVPSHHEYHHQWMWDSCFHAIVLRHFDCEAAESELLSLVASQKKSGRVPHETKYNIFGRVLPYTSRITQPPFIARAALEVYRKSGNKEFLSAIFPSLQSYNTWLEREREYCRVLKVVNPNESGEDNSILWDVYAPLPVHRAYGWLSAYLPLPQLLQIKSVTSTCIYADALECMAGISGVLKEKELQRQYARKRESVVAAMARTFKQSNGVYYSLTYGNKPIPYNTHSIFSPLFASALEKAEAKRLVVEYLLDTRKFWTPFAIPTVAVNERKFNPKGYWRGPMWVNVNWMLHRGLVKYGFRDAAQQLLEKTVAVIEKSGFYEYYNPLSGKGLGTKEFAWSTLVTDMMHRSH